MNHELPYSNPLVRDLAWALCSPPLLQRKDRGVTWLDSDWFEQITDRYEAFLQQLDARPQPLQEIVHSQKDRRLGNYFETLWGFWLNTGDRYRLLCANLPLRSARRTLGEFDFLVTDTQTGKTLHWEIAVKFYLGTGDTTQPCNWWGPARRDRLDIKTSRMLEHQGRLSQRQEARDLLAARGLKIDETWLILKGRLFYPFPASVAAPRGCHPGHLRGFWLPQRSLEQLGQSALLPLQRHQWLAPVRDVDPSACVEGAALARKCMRRPLQRPLCLARISDGRELQRGFVVPDDWDRDSAGADQAGSARSI